MADFDPEKLKHKPNEKHTLDEVLKSLQDLIHNDLLRGGAKPETTAASPEADADPATTEGDMPVSPGSTASNSAIPFESVVESLEELVAKDLAGDDQAAQDASTQATPEPEKQPPAPSPRKNPDSAQQTFGFGEEESPLAPPASAETPVSDMPAVDFDVDSPSTTAEPAPAPDIPILTESVPAQGLADDDIPVLEDVAATGALSAADEIAERVVARLNTERQARGQPTLDAEVLEALRALLREELERNPPG